MKLSVEIKSDITPQNLEAKVREYAYQVAADKMGSMLSAQRVAQFHRLLAPKRPPFSGVFPLPGHGSVAKAHKSVWPGGSIFPRTPAQEAVQRMIDIRMRAFLKR
jgi:hypothetical protein